MPVTFNFELCKNFKGKILLNKFYNKYNQL